MYLGPGVILRNSFATAVFSRLSVVSIEMLPVGAKSALNEQQWKLKSLGQIIY